MNLHPSIKVVKTVRLFNKKYKYKIVVRTPVAHWFRHNRLDFVSNRLDTLRIKGKLPYKDEERLKNSEDYEYTVNLLSCLKQLVDYGLRVESPLITVYSNSKKDIEELANIEIKHVKYVSLLDDSVTALDPNKILLKRLNYDFRINLKESRQSFDSFLKWAENNPKIRLTNRAKRDLGSRLSFGGAYFYVKDEKTLSMVRMFVGPCIRSIETVIKL